MDAPRLGGLDAVDSVVHLWTPKPYTPIIPLSIVCSVLYGHRCMFCISKINSYTEIFHPNKNTEQMSRLQTVRTDLKLRGCRWERIMKISKNSIEGIIRYLEFSNNKKINTFYGFY